MNKNKEKDERWIFLLILCLFISLINIYRWYKWYNNRKVDICIDIDYFLTNGIAQETLVKSFSALGIVKFVVDLEYLLKENFILPFLDKSVIIKIYETKFYNQKQVLEFVHNNRDKIFSIIYVKNVKDKSLCYGTNFVLHFGKRLSEIEVLNLIKNYGFIKLNFEGVKSKQIVIPSQKVVPLRGFLYSFEQYSFAQDKSFYTKAVIKIKKAVFERSCSVIYIIPSTFLSIEDNIKVISEILKKIKLCHFNSAQTHYIKFASLNLKIGNNILVVVLTIIFPLIFFKNCIHKIKTENYTVMKSFFYLNSLFLFTGITFWGLLVRYEYISLEEFIYGTKLMFMLPVIVSFFVFLTKKELKYILNYQLKTKHILFIFLSLTFVTYMLLRSGNVSEDLVPFFEIKIREIIENYILFRPRFKDVFFTQPLLVISLELLSDKKYYDSVITKLLLCISIFSFTSIVNTFLHVHTPVWICILRCVLGMILGFIFGKILWATMRNKLIDVLFNL